MLDSQITQYEYIGIDIGGTNSRIGLFSSLETPRFELLAKFPTSQSYQQQLQTLITSIGNLGMPSLAGVGVSIAGRIAKDGRSVVIAPNLTSYVDQPFAQDLADALNCPVRLAHDPVCGLLAEKKFGTLQSFERCAYLTVSTGTGAAIHFSKGNTHLTSSIEIGHQILDGNPLICLCGQVGCLETFTGGRQLTLRYGHTPAEMVDPAFWETFCTKLALGLINLVMLTRVDAVAVSGAIVLSRPHLLTQLQQQVNAMLKWASLELRIAVLGEDAPLIGAATLIDTPEDTILH